MDITHLSQKELAELINAANKRKKVLAKRKPASAVKNAVNRFLLQNGWTFEELYGRSTGRSRSSRRALSRRADLAPRRWRAEDSGGWLEEVPREAGGRPRR